MRQRIEIVTNLKKWRPVEGGDPMAGTSALVWGGLSIVPEMADWDRMNAERSAW